MELKFFFVPLDSASGSFDGEIVQQYVKKRQVVAVSHSFVDRPDACGWAVLVTAREVPRPGESRGTESRGQVDWRERCNLDSRPIFDAIRTWRNGLASRLGRPAYAIFTNRTMLELAEKRPVTVADVAKIAGIGNGRIHEYGEDLVKVIMEAVKTINEIPKMTDFNGTEEEGT